LEWQIIVALAVMVPVILVPVMFVWFLNIGGLVTVMKRIRERQAAWRKRKSEVEVSIKQ
jgi:hypothetical protein